jgi:hypothetical protein
MFQERIPRSADPAPRLRPDAGFSNQCAFPPCGELAEEPPNDSLHTGVEGDQGPYINPPDEEGVKSLHFFATISPVAFRLGPSPENHGNPFPT